MTQRLGRPLVGGLAGVLTGLLIAAVPSLQVYAHVTVSSPDAAPGGFGKIVFLVPNESDSANTTEITVQLPADTPFRFVSVGAVAGWTAATTVSELPEPVEIDGFTLSEAVSSVTWTADGGGLPPEQFAEFELSVGPFPDGVDQLVFPSTQSYSDGQVVAWTDPTVTGEQEPEHPAPALGLAPATAADEQSSDATSDRVARALGIAGVALGAAGLAIGLSARHAHRRGDAA
jgi:periplasmic copper chaperone A